MQHERRRRATEDLLDEVVQHLALSLLLGRLGTIDVRFACNAVDQVAFTFEHANDRQYRVVVWFTGNSLLNLASSSLAQVPDDIHDFELFIGKRLGRSPWHCLSSPGFVTD